MIRSSEASHDLLSITKLYVVFDAFDNERDAIASYRVPVPVDMAP